MTLHAKTLIYSILMATKNTFNEVKIEANSRLHLGFISLNSSTPVSYTHLTLPTILLV